MSLSEFLEWMAYYEIEPWGSQVDGVRAAVNTSAVYNAALLLANPKKFKSSQCKPEDFLVGVNKPKKVYRTWETQRDMLDKALVKRLKDACR